MGRFLMATSGVEVVLGAGVAAGVGVGVAVELGVRPSDNAGTGAAVDVGSRGVVPTGLQASSRATLKAVIKRQREAGRILMKCNGTTTAVQHGPRDVKPCRSTICW